MFWPASLNFFQYTGFYKKDLKFTKQTTKLPKLALSKVLSLAYNDRLSLFSLFYFPVTTSTPQILVNRVNKETAFELFYLFFIHPNLQFIKIDRT